ncbi:alpha/beta fold hydrolase [Persicitalea sp.]|uniref:alpha/beta fold hydrolase n=1 Tax=Persicitalea sp. TaxID=3100273 RepID=UPI003593A6DF
MREFKILLSLILLTTLSAFAQSPKTYLIVHGAFGGGYAWKKVDSLLTARGNKVYRPTLTGLGERYHLASSEVDLSTHVADIVNVILFEDLHNIVLVGHSYGGMVVTGVADSLPDRTAQIVYIDAHIAEDRKSAFDLRVGGTDLLKYEKDGMLIPPFVADSESFPHNVPQSVATLTERRPLRRPHPRNGKYILTVDDPQKPEADAFYQYEKVAKDLGWQTYRLTADHNPQNSKPEDLVKLLQE